METNGDFFPCLLFRPLNGRFFPVGWLWSSDGEESKGQNFAPPWRPWHPASIHTTPGSPTSASCSAPGPHMWASLRLLASALPHHGLGLPPQQPRDTIPASGGDRGHGQPMDRWFHGQDLSPTKGHPYHPTRSPGTVTITKTAVLILSCSVLQGFK